MMTILTLDAASHNDLAPEQLRARLQPWFQDAGIDLLCCQSIQHAMDGQNTLCHLLVETLGLTYSSFAAGRLQPDLVRDGQKTSRGLAMLTGNEVWVLNSGSFVVGDAGEEEIVQFTLLRKKSASVLALNLHLADRRQAQVRQLGDLFLNPLLKEKYGAVVLCAARPAALSLKEWQTITSRSNFSLHRKAVPAGDCGGMLCLFTARNEAVATVIVRQPESGRSPCTVDVANFPGLSLEFEMQRVAADRRRRSYFPLSFREQWLGFKEHRALD